MRAREREIGRVEGRMEVDQMEKAYLKRQQEGRMRLDKELAEYKAKIKSI